MLVKIKSLLCNGMIIMLSGIVTLIAPIVANECRYLWYQDTEPEGLSEFIKTM